MRDAMSASLSATKLKQSQDVLRHVPGHRRCAAVVGLTLQTWALSYDHTTRPAEGATSLPSKQCQGSYPPPSHVWDHPQLVAMALDLSHDWLVHDRAQVLRCCQCLRLDPSSKNLVLFLGSSGSWTVTRLRALRSHHAVRLAETSLQNHSHSRHQLQRTIVCICLFPNQAQLLVLPCLTNGALGLAALLALGNNRLSETLVFADDALEEMQ